MRFACFTTAVLSSTAVAINLQLETGMVPSSSLTDDEILENPFQLTQGFAEELSSGPEWNELM